METTIRRILLHSESESDILSRDDRSSQSSAPPAIATSLLEMGFSLRHIEKAINVTKCSGDVSAHAINILASWMLEHPLTESGASEDNIYCSSSSEDGSIRGGKLSRTPGQDVSNNCCIIILLYCELMLIFQTIILFFSSKIK